ncbi:ABC transporter permease [Niastella koreensis]|uniref:Probable membrane transporter protein n=2 Tax=Niastella koreensis TaxID=354356 RepID=G8TQF7_NIAKG|nr:TSUP family transporter [Niastella koreensis]AEW03204.1 siroheme synthase [Niastella koreensis GR20-10]OQP55503.1 ABC transporter permease [Niastella koreensis]
MATEQQLVEEQTGSPVSDRESNRLFPVFLKLEELRVLLVGGGKVGTEKLTAILGNSPAAVVTVVAITISDEVCRLASQHPQVVLQERPFNVHDLDNKDVVVIAVNDKEISSGVRNAAKEKGLLVNVADTPDQCDFYLSSIVQKGNLKIAISTNGKSPTMAKRLKEMLHQALPNEVDDVINNMHLIRNKLNGNFDHKVKELNNITKVLVEDKPQEKIFPGKKIALYAIGVLLIMLLGHVVFSFITLDQMVDFYHGIDPNFYWMCLTGFLAQIVAGSMGMGYGVMCTTVLLTLGISPPAISSSIHTAETFTSGVTAYSHYKYGNVNAKLAKSLVLPGVIGAVVGSLLLAKFGDDYAKYIRPVLAGYTLLLGIRILLNAFKKNKTVKQGNPNIPVLATIGGFIDAFGGGGWGPLMTGTMVKSGRTPRFAIGSVCVGKFFITLASAITFFASMGISHWPIIAGLFLGGIIAAPFSARLASKLPPKTMFVCVGIVVVLCSLKIITKIF